MLCGITLRMKEKVDIFYQWFKPHFKQASFGKLYPILLHATMRKMKNKTLCFSSLGRIIVMFESVHIYNYYGNSLNLQMKGSLTVWALYAYFSDSQNAAFELRVWCM